MKASCWKRRCGMNLFTGHLLPGFYNYGSLQFYLVCFANSARVYVRRRNIVPKTWPSDYPQWARMYLIGRCLTVGDGRRHGLGDLCAGAASVGPPRRACWRRGILAIMPLHAQHSHWLTVDVPATFWGMLSLLWAAKLHDALRENAPGKDLGRCALWAGVFAGLAAATKYNMALSCCPLSAGLRARAPGLSCCWRGWYRSAAAFLAACPGALLETPTFLADVRFEVAHVSRQPGPTFTGTGNGFVYACHAHAGRRAWACRCCCWPWPLWAMLPCGGRGRQPAGRVCRALLCGDQPGRGALCAVCSPAAAIVGTVERAPAGGLDHPAAPPSFVCFARGGRQPPCSA